MENDLLARICAELEQRMAELRPLLDEYERLTEAAATLAATEPETTAADSPSTPRPAAARRGPRAKRGSAAGAIARAAAPEAQTPASPPEPSPSRQAAAEVSVSSLAEPFEDEPEPARKATASEVQQAIVAALEHGSHTVSELVMVTAMRPTDIRGNLSRLTRQRKITKVKRQGDGKSAYALPASAAQA